MNSYLRHVFKIYCQKSKIEYMLYPLAELI